MEFVDTNILIYAYDKSAGEKHRLASQLVTGLWRSRIGCLSVQVLQELYLIGARKLTQIAPADLRLILTELGLWRVYSPGQWMSSALWTSTIAIKYRSGMP